MEHVQIGNDAFDVNVVLECMRQSSFTVLLQQWKEFGRKLGLGEIDIFVIQQRTNVNPDYFMEVPREILRKWRALRGASATLKVLLDVLVDCGVRDMAEMIRDKFLCGEEKNITFILQEKILKVDEVFLDKTTASYKRFVDQMKSTNSNYTLEPIQLLGKQTAIPDQQKYYIPRTLSHRNKVKKDIFNHKLTKGHIFLVSNILPHELERFARDGDKVETSENQLDKITSRLIIMQREQDFDEMFQITQKPLHFFGHEDGVYYWKRSSQKLDVVLKFLDNEAVEYEEQSIIAKVLALPRGSKFCISDSPGMGKTFLLANLASNFKEKNSSATVIFIVLHEFAQHISGVKSVTKAIEAVANYSSQNKDEISKIVLNQLMQSTSYQFDIFLDGYDEIGKEKVACVSNFLRHMRNAKNVNLFVTTRPHLKNSLVNAVAINSYEILPFSVSNQLEFLTRYWVDQYTAKDGPVLVEFARECLSALKEKMTDDENEIAGVPLQCMMLAEVYAKDAVRVSQAENGNTSFVVKVTSIFDMFRELIRLKFQRIKKFVQVNEGNFRRFKSLRENYMQAHVYEAIKILFPEWIQRLEKHLPKRNEDVEDNAIYSIGLLVPYGYHANSRRFIHRTFAEYLLAEFLVKNVTRCRECMELVFRVILFSVDIQTKELAGPDFYNLNFSVVAYFVNQHLKVYLEDYAIDAVLINHYLMCQKYMTECYENIFMATAACCCLDLEYCFDLLLNVFFQESFHSEQWIVFRDKHFKCLPHLALYYSTSTTFITKVMVFMYDKLKVDLGCWVYNAPIPKSLKKPTWNEDMFTNPWISNCTPLHVAVYRGNFNIVSDLLRLHGAYLRHIRFLMHVCVKDSDKDLPSTVASKKSILEFLMTKSKEHDIDWLNESFMNTGCRPVLQKNVHVELLKFLVQLGAFINFTLKELKIMLRRQDNFKNYKSVLKWLTNRDFKMSTIMTTEQLAIETIFVTRKFREVDDEFLKIIKESEDVILAADGDQSPVLINVHGFRTCSKDLVRRLVAAGVNVNRTNRKNQNVMHIIVKCAVQHDYTAAELLGIFDLLVKGGFQNIHLADIDGNTPFFLLMGSKHLNKDIAIFFLENGSDYFGNNGTLNFVLLRALNRTKNIDVIRTIIDYGYDINHLDESGRTVVHYAIAAASKNHHTADELLSILNLLIQHGFKNLNCSDNDGETPVLVVMKFKSLNIDLIDFFHTHGANFAGQNKYGESALFIALRNTNDTEVIDKILEYGADVNHRDNDKNNAMHTAIKYAKDSDCSSNELRKRLGVLIAKGFSMRNVPNKFKNTPLLNAMSFKNLDVTLIDFFHGNGFDFTLTDNAGNSVLFEGIRYQQSVENINKIIEYGCNIYHRNNSGQSALHIATKYVHYDALSLLNKLDLNSTDKEENTALHYIFYPIVFVKDQSLILKLLIVSGAKLDIKNKDGQIPFVYWIHIKSCYEIPSIMSCLSPFSSMLRFSSTSASESLTCLVYKTGSWFFESKHITDHFADIFQIFIDKNGHLLLKNGEPFVWDSNIDIHTTRLESIAISSIFTNELNHRIPFSDTTFPTTLGFLHSFKDIYGHRLEVVLSCLLVTKHHKAFKKLCEILHEYLYSGRQGPQ